MIHFTFGIGRHFGFSFRIGSPTCPCQNENYSRSLSYDRMKNMRHTCGKGGPSVGTPAVRRSTFEIPQYKLGPAVEPVKTVVTVSRIPPSCHFLIIPPEIRAMIYDLLMLNNGFIVGAHKLVGSERSVMVGNRPQIKDMDATILRTSRQIYREALPTLYWKNNFSFDSPDAIKDFAFCGLPRDLSFGLKPSQYGRLTMLTKVHLTFGFADAPNLREPRQPADRERLWMVWRRHFEPYHSKTTFPALQLLWLDFIDWDLDDGKESELDVSYQYQLPQLHQF